ncbi:type II secretion system inner membrane protein GspF [Pantoea dispersa]|uniref:type II secretion system inner membrane protein GspF n=1 Tax=Pantoea dispersa TaxID=59814 RepID=UPI0039B6E027
MHFRWQALDAQGQKQRGKLSADSERHARQQLRDRQLQPLKLTPCSAHCSRRGLPQRDLVLMIRQLATLISAKLPLAQSLQTLAAQNENSRQRQLLETLHQQVLNGSSLAEAVADYPETFSPLYRAMIAAGEASGKLERVLEQLADYSEKTQQLKSKLLQALIYPLLLTVVALAVVMILLTAVVPEVVLQFSHMQQNLPATTRLLMTLSELAQRWGVPALGALLLLLVVFRLALRQPARRKRWHQRCLQLPVIGAVALNLNLARYARTLSILTSSAVPLLESMAIAAAVLSNDFVRERLQQAADRVREGVTLTQSLTESALMPPMMRHMIASGEQSGDLNQMLTRIADIQDQSFISKMTLALSLFEPLLIVVMAAVVLFIILAILQPLLQLNSLTG